MANNPYQSPLTQPAVSPVPGRWLRLRMFCFNILVMLLCLSALLLGLPAMGIEHGWGTAIIIGVGAFLYIRAFGRRWAAMEVQLAAQRRLVADGNE